MNTMIRVSWIKFGSRTMISRTSSDHAEMYLLASAVAEPGYASTMHVSEISLYAASKTNPYNFTQQAKRHGDDWMVSLKKKAL